MVGGRILVGTREEGKKKHPLGYMKARLVLDQKSQKKKLYRTANEVETML